MFDMGGEYHCYTADISRSFPVTKDGNFTEARATFLLLASCHFVLIDRINAKCISLCTMRSKQ
jgi:Xaa-Pro aminopeptidase